METVIIGIIVLLALGAVAFPLLRGSRGPHDAREYANAPLAATTAITPEAGVLPAAELGSGLEAEIARYREAITAGTLCGKCGAANARDARFCLECGARLPVEDEREFSA
jgi:hypothetical protein